MASATASRPRGEGKPRGAGAPKRPRGKPAAQGALARWWKVGLLVLLATIGLPVAHALFGEVVALLGGAILFGFLLGRWTAK